jgi:hypothetical protein
MSESTERLNLIQRAAKRLADQPVAETRPAVEQPVMRREPVAAPPPAASGPCAAHGAS